MAKNKRQRRREQKLPPTIIFEHLDVPKTEFLEWLTEFEDLDENVKEFIRNQSDSSIYSHCCLVQYELPGQTYLDFSDCFPSKLADNDPIGRVGTLYRHRLINGKWIADDMVLHFGG